MEGRGDRGAGQAIRQPHKLACTRVPWGRQGPQGNTGQHLLARTFPSSAEVFSPLPASPLRYPSKEIMPQWSSGKS